MKKSAHQIWKESQEQNLSKEEFKEELKTEGIIVKKPTVIERLEEADNQLAADGYKEWCNVRIAISEALKELDKLIKASYNASVGTRFYDPNLNIPKASPDDNSYSVDVFIIDEDDLHGIAFYSFEDMKWIFHTETLVDYDEPGAETKWRWYYPPFTKEDAGLLCKKKTNNNLKKQDYEKSKTNTRHCKS